MSNEFLSEALTRQHRIKQHFNYLPSLSNTASKNNGTPEPMCVANLYIKTAQEGRQKAVQKEQSWQGASMAWELAVGMSRQGGSYALLLLLPRSALPMMSTHSMS
jgi:hypothetical protein